MRQLPTVLDKKVLINFLSDVDVTTIKMQSTNWFIIVNLIYIGTLLFSLLGRGT